MIRHTIRLGLLLAIGFLALLNNYSSLKGQYGGQAIIENSPIYSRWDKMRGSSPHLEPYAPVAQGSLWSFSIGSFRISDPLAFLSAPAALWTTVLIPIFATLLFGRVYCGWLCPMGLFSELVMGTRKLAARLGVEFFNVPVSPRLKYLVLGMGSLLTLFGGVSFFYAIYPPRIISDLLRDAFVGKVTFFGAIFLGIILILELLCVERLWCRCLCPGGAIYSLLGRFRLLRIDRSKSKCTACGECDAACPHDLKPSSIDLTGECDNCGLCKRSCEYDALRYTVSVRRSKEGDNDEDA